MEDFNVIAVEVRLLPTLMGRASDPACPSRQYLLGGMYCPVWHEDRNDRCLADACSDGANATTVDAYLSDQAGQMSAAHESRDTAAARALVDWYRNSR